MTSEDIAKALFISKKTVDNHRQNLLVKTGSKSSIGLVKFAIKAGLEIQ
jgi:DNA-binding NarL/FixJ family response regulator